MERKIEFDENYKLFGSKGRGEVVIEKILDRVIEEKQTPENLEVLAKSVAAEWKNTEANVSRLKLAFSDLEKKIEKMRPEIESYYATEKIKKLAVNSF